MRISSKWRGEVKGGEVGIHPFWPSCLPRLVPSLAHRTSLYNLSNLSTAVRLSQLCLFVERRENVMASVSGAAVRKVPDEKYLAFAVCVVHSKPAELTIDGMINSSSIL